MTVLKPIKINHKFTDKFCALISAGLAVQRACEVYNKQHDVTVAEDSIYHIIANYDRNREYRYFFEEYEKARITRLMIFEDQIIKIADDGTQDWTEKVINDNGETVTLLQPENIQRSRLRIDARKWLMSKLMPQQYGDRVEVVDANNKKLSLEDIKKQQKIIERKIRQAKRGK